MIAGMWRSADKSGHAKIFLRKLACEDSLARLESNLFPRKKKGGELAFAAPGFAPSPEGTSPNSISLHFRIAYWFSGVNAWQAASVAIAAPVG